MLNHLQDETRHFMSKAERKTWDARMTPMSNYFASLNRNKLSIALDLKDSRARNVMFKLVEQSDVVWVLSSVPGSGNSRANDYSESRTWCPARWTSLGLVTQCSAR